MFHAAVELKNDVVLTGTLHSVDQYLNVKLTNVSVVDKQRYPQLLALTNCFVRGSVVRYIQVSLMKLYNIIEYIHAEHDDIVLSLQIPKNDVDTGLLQDATRKENSLSNTSTKSESSAAVVTAS